MLDDSITERKIEDWHVKTDKDPDESQLDGEDVQLNIDQKSYREQSISDNSGKVTKNCDQGMTKARKSYNNWKAELKKTLPNLNKAQPAVMKCPDE